MSEVCGIYVPVIPLFAMLICMCKRCEGKLLRTEGTMCSCAHFSLHMGEQQVWRMPSKFKMSTGGKKSNTNYFSFLWFIWFRIPMVYLAYLVWDLIFTWNAGKCSEVVSCTRIARYKRRKGSCIFNNYTSKLNCNRFLLQSVNSRCKRPTVWSPISLIGVTVLEK